MRKPAFVVIGLLVGALATASVAGAVGTVRPSRVTASVSPPHRGGPPYTYTTSGKIIFPSVFCAPGITNPAYCTQLTAAEVCTGIVQIKIFLNFDPLLKRSNYRLATVRAKVGPKCTYSITTKFKTSIFTAKKHYASHATGAWAHIALTPVFFGNAVLAAFNVHVQHVLAKVSQP